MCSSAFIAGDEAEDEGNTPEQTYLYPGAGVSNLAAAEEVELIQHKDDSLRQQVDAVAFAGSIAVSGVL